MATTPDPVAVVERGLAVFALPPRGRHPAPGWQQRCTTDREQLRRTWRAGDNIGIGCRASGIVVLDLDRGPGSGGEQVDGTAELAARCRWEGRMWPDTFTVSTPCGGRHLYFRAPANCTIGSGVLAPGIDVRGPGRRLGGYVIGPGSIVGGILYGVFRDTAIAELPDWLAHDCHRMR